MVSVKINIAVVYAMLPLFLGYNFSFAMEQKVIYSSSSKVEKIFKAIRNGDIEAVRKFLNKKSDVNTKDQFGNTLLHCVIDSTPKMSGKFKSDKALEKIQDKINKFHEIFSLLLTNKANINLKNNLGQTPLHRAVNTGDLFMIEYLKKLGANINVPDESGVSPVYQAVFRGTSGKTLDAVVKGGNIRWSVVPEWAQNILPGQAGRLNLFSVVEAVGITSAVRVLLPHYQRSGNNPDDVLAQLYPERTTASSSSSSESSEVISSVNHSFLSLVWLTTILFFEAMGPMRYGSDCG